MAERFIIIACTMLGAVGYQANMADFIYSISSHVFAGGSNPFRLWQKQTNSLCLLPVNDLTEKLVWEFWKNFSCS